MPRQQHAVRGKTWHIFSLPLHQQPFWSPQLTFHGIIYNDSYHSRKVLKLQRTCSFMCAHTHTLKHTDNHSLFLPTQAYRHTHTHTKLCSWACAYTHFDIITRALVGIIALTRPNCLPFICMSMATHILHDSPFDKEGSFPQQRKWSPVDIVWLDFAFSRFSGSLQEFIWSVAENETATLFPRLIILIPLSFLLSFSFLSVCKVCHFQKLKSSG